MEDVNLDAADVKPGTARVRGSDTAATTPEELMTLVSESIEPPAT